MKHKKLIISLSIVIGLIAVALAVFFIYVGSYYEADMEAVATFEYDGFDVREIDEGTVAYAPKGDFDTGVVFYPGGKVEYRAYIPLAQALASRGILCILVDMPFNLAVFDIDRADGVYEGFVMVDHWYMAGHSLGGSMACEYALEKQSVFDGVILLASYSAADLSETDLKVLSIYGSADEVLNKESYVENKINLPEKAEEYIIPGGNHAYFGAYGEQSGDGTAEITNKEQIELTAEKIFDFVKQSFLTLKNGLK